MRQFSCEDSNMSNMDRGPLRPAGNSRSSSFENRRRKNRRRLKAKGKEKKRLVNELSIARACGDDKKMGEVRAAILRMGRVR